MGVRRGQVVESVDLVSFGIPPAAFLIFISGYRMNSCEQKWFFYVSEQNEKKRRRKKREK